MYNRLHLDFALESQEERNQFLQQYLEQPQFRAKPPTESELETMGNYLLWGKKDNGRNVVQDKEIQLDSNAKIWYSTESTKVDSLDALLEDPVFSENSLRPLTAPQLKVTQEKFSRSKARKNAPDYLLPIFEDLWRRIDTIDLILSYYDWNNGKRKEPPRVTLIETLGPDVDLDCAQRAANLDQKTYLKLKHRLVELRREQFTYKDSYTSLIQHNTTPAFSAERTTDFQSEVLVYPLGLFSKQEIPSLIFQHELRPDLFTEEQLLHISNYYWSIQGNKSPLWFDFCDTSHVYQLFNLFFEMIDAGAEGTIESNTKDLMRTLDFYVEEANLSNMYKDILEMKKKKHTNQEIVKHVNKTYWKSYSSNYISTLFNQKIIAERCNAARLHFETVGNLWFPENFKKCNTCGKTYLICEDYFVHRSNNKDGYANRCKSCDKIYREKKKMFVSKIQ